MYSSQGTCQALAIFEQKEKEKERLAKEKAEREEREGPTSTGIMVAFIIIKWLKDCFKNKKKMLTSNWISRGGRCIRSNLPFIVTGPSRGESLLQDEG